MVSFFINVLVIILLHDELVGVGTSVNEVDAAGETAEVDGVGTDVAFHSADSLTHDVVDHDVGALAKVDIELVNGGVGIDVHLHGVVLRNVDTSLREELLIVNNGVNRIPAYHLIIR